MGTFLEFYKINKTLTPKPFVEKMVYDQYEDMDSMNDDSFFDLSIDDPNCIIVKRFERGGNIRQLFDRFVLKKGFLQGVWNQSMVVSKEFLQEFLVELERPPSSEMEETLLIDRTQELIGWLREILEKHDFETEYLFFTYF